MAWLHTWAGLFLGWLLFAIFLTGTLSVFAHEITEWMRPELRQAGAAPQAEAIARAQAALEREAPHAPLWQIVLPHAEDEPVEIRWRQGGRRETRFVDAATGGIVPVRETEGGEFFVAFHYCLLSRPAGIWVVAAVSIGMLALLLSGVIIHKRIFRDFFTFRPAARAPHRAWLDAHNVCGVLALPFHLMITYTGLAIMFSVTMPVGLQVFYGGSPGKLRADIVTPFERPVARQPAPLLPLASLVPPAEAIFGPGRVELLTVYNPGDANAVVDAFRRFDDQIAAVADHAAFEGTTGRPIGIQTAWNPSALVWRSMVGLHLAQFGGPAMRWLYFLSGLAGSAMIATGLVMFTVKRAVRHGAATGFDAAVARINVATVAGVVVACIAYLWLNRLLPAGMAGREAWEMGLLLPIWLATLLHAALRPPPQGWREQFGLAALLCLALPLLDLATGGGPFQHGLAAPGPTEAVDLTAFGCGLGLAWLVRHLAQRPAGAGRASPTRPAALPSRAR
ncbi:PepSY-associated TM helix domain-containing protein [Roseicella frigidaeris]|nr:PepSY-associated TM helix domain-containing protein [Roseicella frigidaeris]